MLTVKVVDSTFSHNPAIGYAGERTGEKPRRFHWDSGPGDADVMVWTDIRLKEAIGHPAKKKIAWLLEPPAINPDMYKWIQENSRVFDAILTHQRFLFEQGAPFYWCPFGGSWIRNWGLFKKTEMVSMLVSPKGLTEGHKLRHKAAKLPGVDAYGNGVNRYVVSKVDALRAYRYAIVIENDTTDVWFTEKLIDAISQGCVPIYRGCPSIGNIFDPRGMILWQEFDELEEIVMNLTVEDYRKRLPHLEWNISEAKLYQCPEDWLVWSYGDLLW